MSLLKNKYELGRIEILFIVLVLLAVVGVGLYAWMTDRNKKDEINSFAECVAAGNPVMESYPEQCAAGGRNFTNPEQEAPQAPENQAEETDQTQLALTEWGVKLPLTNEIKDAYYVYKNDYVYLSLQSLADTDCAADKTTVGALSRSDSAAENATKVGEYYYQFMGPQSTCTDDPTIQQAADTARQAFVQAVTQLTAE